MGLGLALVAPAGPAAAASDSDYGDAPYTFEQGDAGVASAVIGGPRLGAGVTADEVDPDSGLSVNASDTALGDEGDDAVSVFGPFPTGRLADFTQTVAVSRVAEDTTVCGWVDFDLSGEFDDVEGSCVAVTRGATSARLTWNAQPEAAGTSYARLRVGTVADEVSRPDGASSDGEVEDYPVDFVAPPPRPRAEISLDKSVDVDEADAVGDPVDYRFVATNTGEVPLHGVTVDDGLDELSALTCDHAAPVSLAPGDALTCRATRAVTQADLDLGVLANLAEVTSEASGGDPDDDSDNVTALDDATVTLVQRPRLSLTATADPTRSAHGKRVVFTFVAVNAGNVTLSSTTVDGGLGALSDLSCTDSDDVLAPGDSTACSGRYRVVKADARRGFVRAAAVVRAEAPGGQPRDSSDDIVARDRVRVAVAHLPRPANGGSGDKDSSTPSSLDGGLADTGGPRSGLVAFGLLLAALGVIGLRRRTH